MEDVRQTFRPEFLNRVDEIIVFQPLGKDEIAGIVDIQLSLLQRRLAERKLTVTLTPAAREYLATAGFDPAYGARPLKRLIQREVQDARSDRLNHLAAQELVHRLVHHVRGETEPLGNLIGDGELLAERMCHSNLRSAPHTLKE